MTKEEAIKIINYTFLNADGHLKGNGPERDGRSIVDALRMAVEALSQPLLPSNLDEAAEETMPEEYGFIEVDIYGGSETVYSREQMLAMFKAGAEWMAGQGYSKEARVWVLGKDETPAVGVDDVIYLPKDLFHRGDKVIVQVRN